MLSHMPTAAPASTRRPVPRYVLYGEHARTASPGFIHVETLGVRSALHGWEIAPHRHEGLQQVFWVREGGGEARLDQVREAFDGPALLIVPAALVHAFTWRPGSEGHVLTMATEYAENLATGVEAAVAASLHAPRILTLTGHEAAADINAAFERLARELRFSAPGMATAVAAQIRLLMVAVARLAPATGAPVQPGAELWQRFRAAVELGFRTRHGVAELAAGLSLTRGRLDAICRRNAGRTAQQIIHDRLTLEAQRSLIYTGLTIAEIAYDLGFVDPAYFTRFFAREAGEPPGEFRRRRRAGDAP